MKRTLKNQQGMSLVEATIILLVLMLLTSVLAPSMYDFIQDAKQVKVKEDCEAIGISTMRLVRDIGPCLKNTSVASDPCLTALYSKGTAGTDGALLPVAGKWSTLTGAIGDMEQQFATNQGATNATIYLAGWRGAYLSAPIGPDPWGTKYGVNAKYLDPTLSGTDLDVDVFCISAGPNKAYDTAFNGNGSGGTTKGTDDFVYVIAGSQKPWGIQ